MIKIARGLELPLDAVTQTFAILAVRGAGKTNLAGVLAEQMFANKLPFVVIDPVGVWWGLRSQRDGKGPGLSIPIFGGRHGDVPLESTGGELLADIVAGERLSCVVDVSEFSEGEKIRFLIAFAERLYRRNEDPLHMFLEEADDYVPQRPFREQARLLRAWENIVRRGRSRGLGITMITQRSAAINKNVLTQIETLFVLRTTSPQDRAAIELWLKHQGQSKTVMATLPGLANGEAWVWSPAWLKMLKRIKVPLRQTFDSGATPKARARRVTTTLATVDLAKISEQMAGTIERAKTTDPKHLRREIELLKKALRTAETANADPDRERRERELADAVAEIERLRVVVDAVATASKDLLETARAALVPGRPGRGSRKSAPFAATRPAGSPAGVVGRTIGSTAAPTGPPRLANGASLPKGERAVLIAAAQHPAGCTRELISIVTGYKRSSRDAYIQRLREKEYIFQPSHHGGAHGGAVEATTAGILALGDFERLPTGAALREHWLAELPQGEGLVLSTVVNAYPDPVSRDVIGMVTGYKRSSRDAYIQRLRTRQLVKTDAHGVTANEVLF